MKLRFLIAALTLWSTAAIAQNWVLIAQDDEVSMYVNEVVKRLAGNQRRYWVVYDHKQPKTHTSGNYLSSLGLFIGDCTDDKTQTLNFWFYSAPMAKGLIVDSVPRSELENRGWNYTLPGSPGDKILRFACSR